MKWIIKNKGIYRVLLLIIILATALLLFISVIRLLDNKNESPSIRHGVLDLSNWTENQNGLISLCGEWEFYWQKLLSHDDLNHSNIKPDLLSKVPEVWNNYRIDGKSLPGQGYATYRLHVITGLPAGTGLGLKAYSFSSAYSLYIDGELVAANGKVSADRGGETGEYRPKAAYFKTPAKEFDIIIQVSNFNYARGGFWNNLYLVGPEK